MDTAGRAEPILTAVDFLSRDQSGFGSAWRYELVDGAIVSGLTASLAIRLRAIPM